MAGTTPLVSGNNESPSGASTANAGGVNVNPTPTQATPAPNLNDIGDFGSTQFFSQAQWSAMMSAIGSSLSAEHEHDKAGNITAPTQDVAERIYGAIQNTGQFTSAEMATIWLTLQPAMNGAAGGGSHLNSSANFLQTAVSNAFAAVNPANAPPPLIPIVASSGPNDPSSIPIPTDTATGSSGGVQDPSIPAYPTAPPIGGSLGNGDTGVSGSGQTNAPTPFDQSGSGYNPVSDAQTGTSASQFDAAVLNQLGNIGNTPGSGSVSGGVAAPDLSGGIDNVGALSPTTQTSSGPDLMVIVIIAAAAIGGFFVWKHWGKAKEAPKE